MILVSIFHNLTYLVYNNSKDTNMNNFFASCILKIIVQEGVVVVEKKSNDVIKRLESSSVKAEEMIQMLLHQINVIRDSTDNKILGALEEAELKRLANENAMLRKTIMQQKQLLITSQSSQGRKLIICNLPLFLRFLHLIIHHQIIIVRCLLLISS